MSEAGQERCSVCGQQAEAPDPMPGTGPLCDSCLLAGRFLGSTGSLRLAQAARRLPELSHRARKLVDPTLNEAARLADRKHHEAARGLLLDGAGEHLRAGRPLLAAFFLQAALQIPGDSSAVYAGLGDAALAMDCENEAAQHYKTAGWLAMQMGDRGLVERTAAGLRAVCPQDPWVDKAGDWLAGKMPKAEPRCGFCGQAESAVGKLIEGPQAAICGDCLKRLANGRDS